MHYFNYRIFVESSIMRKVTFILSFVLCSLLTLGQVEEAKEVSIQMSKGVQQGWKILIPEANNKSALKHWEKLMKAYDSKTSKVKKHDEYVSETCLIPSLSERTIVTYTQFNETPEGVYMIVFFDLGGAYLNSHLHQEKVKSVQKLLMTYAKEVALEAIDEKVKIEEKNLKKLEGEKDNLKSNQDSYEKEIKDCEERIAQRKKDLESNKEEQQKKSKEIEEQESKLEEIKNKKKKY